MFTERQIENWKRYEEIRKIGSYNMLLNWERGCEESKMTEDEWMFCIHNYGKLAEYITKQ